MRCSLNVWAHASTSLAGLAFAQASREARVQLPPGSLRYDQIIVESRTACDDDRRGRAARRSGADVSPSAMTERSSLASGRGNKKWRQRELPADDVLPFGGVGSRATHVLAAGVLRFCVRIIAAFPHREFGSEPRSPPSAEWSGKRPGSVGSKSPPGQVRAREKGPCSGERWRAACLGQLLGQRNARVLVARVSESV